jgi:hypothetical protein
MFGGELAACVASIDGVQWLDQQDVGFLVRLGAMFDAAGYDAQLALLKLDVAIAELNRRPSAEDEEEVIGFVVLVPDGLAETIAL